MLTIRPLAATLNKHRHRLSASPCRADGAKGAARHLSVTLYPARKDTRASGPLAPLELPGEEMPGCLGAHTLDDYLCTKNQVNPSADTRFAVTAGLRAFTRKAPRPLKPCGRSSLRDHFELRAGGRHTLRGDYLGPPVVFLLARTRSGLALFGRTGSRALHEDGSGVAVAGVAPKRRSSPALCTAATPYSSALARQLTPLQLTTLLLDGPLRRPLRRYTAHAGGIAATVATAP